MKKSFTLIEILIVIVVIGVLSAFILVGMSSITNSASIAKFQKLDDSLRNSLLMNLVGEWKLNEATGTPLITLDSWKASNGTLGNGSCSLGSGTCPTFISGSTGQCVSQGCMSFDGTDDYISFTTNSNLNFGTGDFTFTTWFKTDRTSRQHIMGFGIGNGSPNLQFDMNDGGYGMWVYINSSGANETWTTSNYYDNKWHYLVYLRDNGTLKLYVDNVLKDTTAYNSSVNLSSVVYSFGRCDASSGQYYKGLIDDVRIYNAMISMSEMQNNYYIASSKLLISNSFEKEEYLDRITQISNSLSKQ